MPSTPPSGSPPTLSFRARSTGGGAAARLRRAAPSDIGLSKPHTHARLIINLHVIELAEIIAAKGLPVRDAERLARNTAAWQNPCEKDADTKALELDSTTKLALKTEIQLDGRGGRSSSLR